MEINEKQADIPVHVLESLGDLLEEVDSLEELVLLLARVAPNLTSCSPDGVPVH